MMNENSGGQGSETFPKDESVTIDIKGLDPDGESKTTVNSDINTDKNDEVKQSGTTSTCTNNESSADHVGIKIDEEHKDPDPLPDANLSHPDPAPTAEIVSKKPLCADYKSGGESDTETDSPDSGSDSESESDSLDSESDSSSSDEAAVVPDESKTNKKKKKKGCDDGDFSLSDLPPIENLRISVPEEECEEIGTISGIVGTLVVVEAYKNTPAYDIDTVLFLDKGQKVLGKIFDVFGPVSEPVYSVRFNNTSEIQESEVTKGLKVYCAPRTEHSSLVFVSDLMKMKGSDASWKNNEEAPQEFQDFSDDEEEERFRNKGNNAVKSEQPVLPEDHHSKKARFNRSGFGQNTRYDFSRNHRFRMNQSRFPPRSVNNNWALYPHRPRFNTIPHNHFVQNSFQYPAQPFYSQGYYSQGYQQPNYCSNFPPAFPNPQYVYPTANPFLLPPPGPPPPGPPPPGPPPPGPPPPGPPPSGPPLPGPPPPITPAKNSDPLKDPAKEPSLTNH